MGLENNNQPIDGRDIEHATDGVDFARFNEQIAGADRLLSAHEVADGVDSDAPRSSLIRAVADGEVVAEAVADAEGEIAFERRLREATGRVMGGVRAPQALRDRIQNQIKAQSAADESASATAASEDALAEGLAARAEMTRSTSFWSGSTGRVVGSLAAALVLAVVGVFAWNLGAASNQSSGTLADQTLAYRTDLAQFVAGEHTRALDDEYARRKHVYVETDDAATAIASKLENTPVIPPCIGETKFAGASPCGVPGKGPSAHMQFVLPVHDSAGEIIADAEGRKVSVFVKQDKGELAIDDGTTYLVDSDACNVSDAYICVWRRGGLLYTLVSEDRNAPMCTKFLAQFGVDPPDPANSL